MHDDMEHRAKKKNGIIDLWFADGNSITYEVPDNLIQAINDLISQSLILMESVKEE